MEDARPALTHRAPCRGCGASTAGRFAGWVTEDGFENSIRPRAYYRSCAVCGLRRMVLGGDQEVTDAEGLARAILDDHLIPMGGRATATRSPDGPGATDWEAALWYVVDAIWRLYAEKWDPSNGMSFRSYATGLGKRRLDGYLRDESGEASERPKPGEPRTGRRVHPKAHAASVSVSLDAMQDTGDGDEDTRGASVGFGADDHGGLATSHGSRARDLTDDRSPDLARALAARDR